MIRRVTFVFINDIILLERRNFMDKKKMIINYYALIMLFLFLIYNLIYNWSYLKIEGLLYELLIKLIICVNVNILIHFRKEIKLKKLMFIIYSVILIGYFYSFGLLLKSPLQDVFCFCNIVVFLVLGFMESNYFKVVSIMFLTFIAIFFFKYYQQWPFAYLVAFDKKRLTQELTIQKYNKIDDKLYYCENNYKVHSYVALDLKTIHDPNEDVEIFHYFIGKHYEILSMNPIINISYDNRKEFSIKDYEKYLNSHKCTLVGVDNESE